MKTPKGWTKVAPQKGGKFYKKVDVPTISIAKTSLSFLGFDHHLGTFTIFRRGPRCRVYFEESGGHFKVNPKSNSRPNAQPIYRELGITVTKKNRIELTRARCKGDAWEFDIEGIE